MNISKSIDGWVVIDDWVDIDGYHQNPFVNTTEKREALIHSLAHLRLQQNGHNKEETIKCASDNVDGILLNINKSNTNNKTI